MYKFEPSEDKHVLKNLHIGLDYLTFYITSHLFFTKLCLQLNFFNEGTFRFFKEHVYYSYLDLHGCVSKVSIASINWLPHNHYHYYGASSVSKQE